MYALLTPSPSPCAPDGKKCHTLADNVVRLVSITGEDDDARSDSGSGSGLTAPNDPSPIGLTLIHDVKCDASAATGFTLAPTLSKGGVFPPRLVRLFDDGEPLLTCSLTLSPNVMYPTS